jgi:Domain of unknown function (DUF4091)
VFKYFQFILLFLPTLAFSQIKRVWALGDGEKVFRNDINHPDKNGNFIWDGKTIHLKGLYNEVVAFQVIVETELNGAKGIELSVDAPVHKQSHKIIGGNTLKYGPGGTIEIFSEHYLHVIDSTHPNWYYGSPAAQPKKMTGWIPDALIPVDAMSGRGGFPIDIPALDTGGRSHIHASSQNQGFWIDISLPRNQKNFPPGVYYGMVQVLQNGKIISEIPLEITLLPHYLPDENHSTIWAYSNDISSYFPGLSQEKVDEMIKFEAHRHRVDMSGGFKVNDSFFREDSMDLYKPYLDGTAFTPANGYHGNGEGIGEKIFPIGMYGSDVMGKTKTNVQQQADMWVDWFRKNAPSVTYFWYIIDEPGENIYPWIKERAEWIKTDPGPGKTLPIFTTRSYQLALTGAIDIWAGYDGVELNDLPAARKNGGDYWYYNGNRPRDGSIILEGAAVDFRVNSWIMYKYGINSWFIWHSTNWQHNGSGPKRHLHQNIFKDPLTFINNDMDFGNGDGILFYPGRMPFYPEEDRGLNQLFPSIRLKNIRRGQQDAAIMWLAEKKAGREKVLSIINKIVPKAMSEVDMKATVPWSERGNDYDRVRDELLKLL